ncbi:MAG TPA: serine/threonine-protein kinase, partial [Nannocystis sp.]
MGDDLRTATSFPRVDQASDRTLERPVFNADTASSPRPPVTAPDLEATTAASTPLLGDDASPDDLRRGAQIDRYVVLDRLGAGGMGVVFAAIDPELDRKVALKLLHPELAGSIAGGDARTRLLREAQALAKLSHPNVVTIFDVGTHGDQIWIAMEFVAGRTLRAWLAERRPDWRELLAVMQAAGRGLAAAHAVGLVHRDIKPDNIMIGDDGRVRVMDFGLARRRDAGAPELLAHREVSRPMLSIEVTHAGTMLGTPAYMAPEQFRGESVGPPADVFAFCVMMWEALHGARPFAGGTLAELREAVESQRITRPTRDRVPRRLTAVLLRGLARTPDQRWPNMDALLAALARGQAQTRRRRQFLLAGGLAGAVGLGWGGFEFAHQRALLACERAGEVIRDDWSEARRAVIERALLATGSPAAATVIDKTTPWLDRWAESWQSARTRICLAHDVDRTLDDELHGRAGDCLDELRGNFVALLDTLAEPDEKTLIRATPAASSLPPVAACTDPATLRARPPVSREQRDEVAAIRARLARASSLLHAGKFAAGLDIAKAAIADAAPWPALVAAAEYRAGALDIELGDFPAAEQSFLRALAAARDARASELAADSMTMLVYV